MARAAAAEPGGMAAVLGLDDAAVERLCAGVDGVWPANYNCPGQVVVSGRREALAAFVERAREAGARKVVPLAVSGAFHTPLMEPAVPALREALEGAAWRPPQTRFFSVCSLREETGGFVELLLRQVVSPVRFGPAVSLLQAAGYDAFLEVGPGAVLSGLVRRSAPQARVARVGDLETLAAFAANDDRTEGA
jgi:[acyl-carrier-protein] S-malonyltransferase